MAIVLGANQYGKAEVRVVAGRPRHRPAHRSPTSTSLSAARRLRRHPPRPATTRTCSPPTRRRTPSTPSPGRRDRRDRGVRAAAGPALRRTRTTWITGPGWRSSSTAGTASPSAAGRTTTPSSGTAREVRTAVVTVRTATARRDLRADRPGRAQDDRLASSGASRRGPIHDAGRDRRPDPGHRGDRPLALHRAATWTRQRSPASATTLLETFAARTAWPCSRRSIAMGKAVLEARARRSPRSGCRCRTSTTSCRT